MHTSTSLLRLKPFFLSFHTNASTGKRARFAEQHEPSETIGTKRSSRLTTCWHNRCQPQPMKRQANATPTCHAGGGNHLQAHLHMPHILRALTLAVRLKHTTNRLTTTERTGQPVMPDAQQDLLVVFTDMQRVERPGRSSDYEPDVPKLKNDSRPD